MRKIEASCTIQNPVSGSSLLRFIPDLFRLFLIVCGSEPTAKAEQALSIFKAVKAEESMKKQVNLSNAFALLNLGLAVLPLFFFYLDAAAISDLSTLLYQICAILVILSAALNRVAGIRLKDASRQLSA